MSPGRYSQQPPPGAGQVATNQGGITMDQVRSLVEPVADSIGELKVGMAKLQGTLDALAQTKELEHLALARQDATTNERIAKVESRSDMLEDGLSSVRSRVDRAYWTIAGVAVGAGTAGGGFGVLLYETIRNLAGSGPL